MEQLELNMRLLKACLEEPPDYVTAEKLLQEGAQPLGEVEVYLGKDNLYEAILDDLYDSADESLFRITKLFCRYGMDISKPAIPYDDADIINPLWDFAFLGNEHVLRSLEVLLDYGLRVEDTNTLLAHAMTDFCVIDGSLTEDWGFECLYDYLRKLFLIASYPDILENDPALKDEIWYGQNDYDVTRFRSWENYSFVVDTSHCKYGPHVLRSVITIKDISTGKPVWRFGINMTPDELREDAGQI